MKSEIRYGVETMDGHFNRSSIPDQGYLVHGMDSNDQLIKAAYHFFGSDAASANWSYTLSCMHQFLEELVTSSFLETNDAEKLVFMRLNFIIINFVE